MEARMQDATENDFPNLYASEDHIPAVKSQKSWIKNREKSQNRQNVPENIPNWALPSNRVIQHKINRKNKHKEFLQIFSTF